MKNLILIILSLHIYSKAQAQSCSRVCNSDFDNSILATPGNLAFVTNFDLACWNTTASDGIMEVWSDGFEGVPAFSGEQFIELNANEVSTLYQDITVVPGETFNISFAHRGRWGVDVLSLSIGPIGGPYINLGDFSADQTAWVENNLSYTFPNNGVTNYRLQFNSISSSGGMLSVGNFLDAISVSSANALTIDLQENNIACNPNLTLGSINAVVTGGIGNLTYNWTPSVSTSNNATNLVAGNYELIVVDSIGCSDTAEVEIIGEIPIINVSADITACFGTSVKHLASGNGSISWNNGITNGVDFIPEVGITDYIATSTLANGCQISDTVQTIIHANPVPIFSSNIQEGCESLAVVFTNLTENTQNSIWDFGNGETSSSIDMIQTTYTNSGNFHVSLSITDQIGCEGSTQIPNFITVFPKPIAS
ncbi:MAG: PKD domain-containing protein, partial [Bacteroidota bacterium]